MHYTPDGGGALADAVLRIRIERRSDMDATLEAGVTQLQTRAKLQGEAKGILVTRHSPTEFTLEIHPDVPYGTIREKQDW